MKTFSTAFSTFFILMTVLVSTSASAHDFISDISRPEIHVLGCRQLHGPADASIYVSITKPMNTRMLEARIGMSTFVGPRLVARYTDIKRIDPASDLLGAPIVFSNDNESFHLSVNFTTTPVEGGHYGALTFENRDGMRESHEMTCKFLR